MRGDRREQVAAVEGGRDRLESKWRARELDRLQRAAEAIEGAREQSVVRPDQVAPLRGRDGNRPAGRANSGIDDREVYTGRAGGEGVRERDRAPADVLSRDPVAQVDQRRA